MDVNGFLRKINTKLIKLQDVDLSKYKGYGTGEDAVTPQVGTKPEATDKPAIAPPATPDSPLLGKKPVQIDRMRVKKNYDRIVKVMQDIYQQAYDNDEVFTAFNKIEARYKQQIDAAKKLSDPIKTEVLMALEQFKKEFDIEGISMFDVDKFVTFTTEEKTAPVTEDEMEKPTSAVPEISKYKDLTELEVRNLVQINARAYTGTGTGNSRTRAMEYLKSTKEFKNNPHNMEILEKLIAEGYGKNIKIEKSPMTVEQRSDLIALFEYHYFGTILPEKERIKNWEKVSGKLPDDEYDYEDDEKESPIDFIRDRIFQSIGKKEYFLQFFTENEGNTDVQKILKNLAQEYATQTVAEFEDYYNEKFDAVSTDPEIEAVKSEIKSKIQDWRTFLDNSIKKSDAKIFNFMQSGMFDYFYAELRNIITNHDHVLHQKFFDWVVSKIKVLEQKTKYQGSELEEAGEIASEEEEATQVDEPTADEEIARSTKAVLESFDLNTCNLPKLKLGDFVSPRYVECLKSDWFKVDNYMKDLIAKMNQAYDGLQGVDKTTQEKREFLLSKLLLWEKVYEAMQDVVYEIIGTREARKIVDTDILTLLNRDWNNMLNHLSFSRVDMSLYDDKVQKYTQMAQRDLGLSEEDGYKALLGKGIIDWSSGREEWLRIRKEAYNQLASKDKNFATLLRQYKPDSVQVESAFKNSDPVNYTKITKLRTDNDNKLKNLFEKAQTNLSDLEYIIADRDLQQKYGADTILTFLEVLIKEPKVVEVGVLLSKQNPGTRVDKLEYLYDLVSRGLEFNIDDVYLKRMDPAIQAKLQQKRVLTEAQLDQLSPQQIDTVFSTIRDVMFLVHMPVREAEKFIQLEAQIPNSLIVEIVNEMKKKPEYAKMPQVTTVQDLRNLDKKSRKAFYEQLLTSKFSQYFVEASVNYNAFVDWVAKGLQAICMNQPALMANGQNDPDVFLSKLGINPSRLDFKTDKKSDVERTWYDISQQLSAMSPSKVKEIAKKYLPETYDVFANIRRLLKTGVKHSAEATTIQYILDYMRSAKDAGVSMPDRASFERSMSNAEFLGRMLDLAAQKQIKNAQTRSKNKHAYGFYFRLL